MILAHFARTVLPIWPTFPLDAVQMASSTSQFAAAIAYDGIEDDSEPLGSGILLWYSLLKKFCACNFRGY